MTILSWILIGVIAIFIYVAIAIYQGLDASNWKRRDK